MAPRCRTLELCDCKIRLSPLGILKDNGEQPIFLVVNRPCSSGIGVVVGVGTPRRKIRTAVECGFTVGLGINDLGHGTYGILRSLYWSVARSN